MDQNEEVSTVACEAKKATNYYRTVSTMSSGGTPIPTDPE